MRQVLDDDLALRKRSFQRRPAVRLHQQAAHIQQEIAAVGAMQGAGLDQAKIGRQHASHGQIFDAAGQVPQRRMQLFDDRDAMGVRASRGR